MTKNTHSVLLAVKVQVLVKDSGAERTSVWMVQDHQLSMGFLDLILVGCGTERKILHKK